MMPYKLSPWRKITELSCGKGVKAEWQDFPEEFLAITNSQASAIPCNRHSGCYMNVVQHGPNDIVGICSADIKQCDRRTLKKSELALYQIDYKKLANKIAQAISFTEQFEKITDHKALWKLGVLNPQAEYKFHVYCFLGQTSSQLNSIVSQLCMVDQNFLLVAATDTLISTASVQMSIRHKSKLISLDDVLGIDKMGKVMIKDSAQTIVSNWLETVLPKSAKPSETNQLVLPPGTTWKDITITFLARDVISIKCGGETTVNYERLHIPGMFVASSQEKKPSDKWFLLMAFALWGPGLNRDNLRTLFGHDDWNRMRTQKASLSKSLKQFFGLDDEPIPYNKSVYEYQPILIIRQDTNCDLNDWIGDIHQ